MGEEVRQVVNIEFKRVVTEYRAQILDNELGQRFVAPLPHFPKTSIAAFNMVMG
jgi:transposase